MKYKIYNIDSNAKILENECRGSKEKYWIFLNKQKALIKINTYVEDIDIRSHNVSEKVFSEIAIYLGFSCVKTDFIIDENNKYGIASHDYKSKKSNMLVISGDDLYLNALGRKSFKRKNNNKDEKITKEDYSYNNIVKILLSFDESGKLLRNFNSIMVMDALTGESDRHFENWGIYYDGNTYQMLPMYDNSSCLLHQFRNNNVLYGKVLDEESLIKYCNNSHCKVTIDGIEFKHFDFIDYLLTNLSKELKYYLIKDIKKLKLLENSKIEEIVNSVPNCFCSLKHKNLIIKYIILRRDILLSKVDVYE